MFILKILGIIIAACLLVILVLLLLPVKVVFCAGSGIKTVFEVKYLWFDSSNLGNNKEKNPKNQEKKEKKKKLDLMELAKQNGGVIEFARKIVRFISIAFGKILHLLRHCRLKKLRIKYVCSGKDAAECAIKYGAVCAMFYPFAAFVQENTRSVGCPQEVEISCDYEKIEDYFLFNIELLVPTAYLFVTALYLVYRYYKETIYERRNDHGKEATRQ